VRKRYELKLSNAGIAGVFSGRSRSAVPLQSPGTDHGTARSLPECAWVLPGSSACLFLSYVLPFFSAHSLAGGDWLFTLPCGLSCPANPLQIYAPVRAPAYLQRQAPHPERACLADPCASGQEGSMQPGARGSDYSRHGAHSEAHG